MYQAAESVQQRRERYLRMAIAAHEAGARCPNLDIRARFLDIARSWEILAGEIPNRSNR